VRTGTQGGFDLELDAGYYNELSDIEVEVRYRLP